MRDISTAQVFAIHPSADAGLPEGWAITRVVDLFDYWGGATPSTAEPAYWGGDIPWISSKDVKEWRTSHGTEYVTDKALRDTRLSRCPVGSVLVVVRSGILAHTLPVAITDAEVVINQDLKAFHCPEQSLNEWFALALRAKAPEILATNRKDGTTVQSIRFDQLKELEFPIPPLAEQKRIVTKVELLLARVNAARERLARVPVILKRFRQAVLAAACSGRLTEEWRGAHLDLEPAKQLLERVCAKRVPRKVEVTDLPEIPEEWTWIYLPDLGYMNRGKSRHRPRDASHLYGGPYPFIQTGDIAQSGGRITFHRQTYSETGLAQSRMWPAGTVCVTIAANIANSAILTYPACFPDSVVGVIPDESLCLAEYLEFFIRTARADLDQFAPATAQKNINIGILSDVAVPLPHLSEQHEIVRRVEALFKLADTIEKRVAAAMARTDKLTQAILAKAFRGELVPTEAELARREGRDYEPASVLLARIQAEREARGESAPIRRNSGGAWERRQERRRTHSRAPLHRKD